MAKLSRTQLARYVAVELAGGRHLRANLLRQVAAYLIDHKMTDQVDLLYNDIVLELCRNGGGSVARVTTAHGLSNEMRLSVGALLAQAGHQSGLELEERIEPDLIGGIIIETPDSRYDSSIRHQLQQLVRGN